MTRRKRTAKLGTDARPPESGGKRHGRRLRKTERETTTVDAISPDRIAELIATHGSIRAEVKTRGKRKYATMIVYVDESRRK
jgi:hypothetical protein